MNLVPVQEDLDQYVEAGDSGFVLKDATFHDFLRTIRSLFTQIIDHAARNVQGESACVRKV